MGITSLKKDTILAYSTLPSIEGLENNKLTLVTAAGIIIGTPVLDSPDADANVELLKKANKTIAEKYRQDNNIDTYKPLDGNDGLLMLKDVTLIDGQTRNNFNFLNIFFDQIIAVTIGNTESPSNANS